MSEDVPARRGLVLALVAVVVVLAAVLVYADRRVAASEAHDVDACVAAADRAVDEAYRPVGAMVEYVRASMGSNAARRASYDLIARSAVGRSASLASVREDCAAVEVWSFHGGTEARRDACVARLDAHRRFLAALAADGSAIEAGRPDTGRPC